MSRVSSTAARISTPGNRFTASRTLKTGNSRAIARHNWHVGEVLHAFNSAQASFFLLFWSVAARDDIYLAQSLWHNHPSDASQRRVLFIHAEKRIKSLSLRAAVLWAIAAMDKLSEMRNDAVHADAIWHYDRITTGIGTKPLRAERLLDAPFDKIWRALRGDFSALANYASDLYLDVISDIPQPSTKRPALQLARSTNQKRQEVRRQAKKKARQRQRQSSVV